MWDGRDAITTALFVLGPELTFYKKGKRMDLLFIRHGEPGEDGSLTEIGKREAQLLTERLARLDVLEYNVSPLTRARETAEPVLKKLGRAGIERPWLREFDIPVARPDLQGMSFVPWDWLPQDWLEDTRLRSTEHWTENEVFRDAGVGTAYDDVICSFDALLGEHGYERDGNFYRVRRGNEDTLAFICHFGLICVLLSHLLNCAPMVLWQGLALPPSSVTTLHTEERRPGIAVFRAASVGDISHLYAAGVEPSFAGRFCTMYGNGQRVD